MKRMCLYIYNYINRCVYRHSYMSILLYALYGNSRIKQAVGEKRGLSGVPSRSVENVTRFCWPGCITNVSALLKPCSFT